MTAPDDVLSALREAFAHAWEVRASLLHAMARLPWEEVTRASAAFPRSLADAMLDMLETEAYWAHHVLDGGVGGWKAYDRASATSVDRLAMHARGVQRATAERLKEIPPSELAKPRPAPEEGAWTAGDALLRVLTGNLVEAGVLAARLALAGARPAVPTWRPPS